MGVVCCEAPPELAHDDIDTSGHHDPLSSSGTTTVALAARQLPSDSSDASHATDSTSQIDETKDTASLKTIQETKNLQATKKGVRINDEVTLIPLLTSAALMPTQAHAAADPNGLAAKLSKRDASVLKNSVFNIPPSAQVYPKFMQGEWDVSLTFAGYLFPSKTIPKDKLTANVNIPGFQKCSIAAIPDVGRELTTYRMSIQEGTGLEDRANKF